MRESHVFELEWFLLEQLGNARVEHSAVIMRLAKASKSGVLHGQVLDAWSTTLCGIEQI